MYELFRFFDGKELSWRIRKDGVIVDNGPVYEKRNLASKMVDLTGDQNYSLSGLGYVELTQEQVSRLKLS